MKHTKSKSICTCGDYEKKSKDNYDCKNCNGRNMNQNEFNRFKKFDLI